MVNKKKTYISIIQLIILFYIKSLYSLPETNHNPAKSLLIKPESEIKTIPFSNQKKPKIIIENIDSATFLQAEEQSKGIVRFFGRIKVTLKTGYFYADEVIIDTNRKELFASGNIEYYEENAYITVEKVIYDYEHGYGIFYNGKGYKDPVYFTGFDVKGLGENRFELSDAFFTTCSSQKPHYHFSAKKIFLFDNNEILALGVWYHVGGVPLIPLPFYYSNPWGTGIITQFGYSNIMGYYLQNTYQFSIPEAYLNDFLPIAYRFKLDYYEKTGTFFGAELYRFTPSLSYIMDLGIAEFKRYEISPDFREKNLLRVTNKILQKDGTYKEEKYKWSKIFSLISYNNFDSKKNRTQKLTIKILNYSHRFFEYEFGGRYIPDSTIPALYKTTEPGRGIIQNQNEYVLYYNDRIDDLTINFQASRIKIWREKSNFPDSKYIPVQDIIPTLDISKNIFLGYIFNLPFYWNNRFHYDANKIYTDGKPYYTTHTARFETDLKTYIGFYPFFSFSPSIGYGGQKVSPYNENMSDDAYNDLVIYAKKQSYEYWFTQHQLILGPYELNLELNYTRKDTVREELLDTSLVNVNGFNNRQKINETQIKLNFFPVSYFNLSAESIYDHREFEYKRPYLERWTYPIVRTELYINFLNLFKESRYHLLSRKRIHISEIKISNDYVYDHLNTRDHSNLLGISFIMSNFDLIFFKRLRYLELGYYWYHVYYQPELDHMRFLAKLDIQLTRNIYFEMEMESRLTQPERYTNQNNQCQIISGSIKCIPEEWIPESQKNTTFGQDIINSTGINGSEKRQNSAFNIGYFQGSLIFDLHDWELRFGYELQQKSMLAGVNTINVVNYYDNKIFFSFNFIKFDIGGLSRRPSKFIIHREKVNPFDIAKTQFYIR
ncbi:MAG: membrane protein [Leptospiraceae bacterium]|nr:MAG: membrane protein [Leptospiraceae bacterium]